MQFPTLTMKDLEGRTVEVPLDLGGRVNLLLLGFQREHLPSLESWLPPLVSLKSAFPELGVWRLAALPRSYRFFRSAIESAMRAGVTDADDRRHTLTGFLDLRDFQRALGLADLGAVGLYVVDAAGTIRWHGRGGYDPHLLSDLKQALAQGASPS